MAEEVSVQADPTPDPTPEEAARLRLQFERDLVMWEAAGLTESVEVIKARLAELPGAGVVEEEVVEEPDTGTGKYEDRTVAQLKDLAASKGLPTSGTKAELIEMLREA
jgi:hypothetical protein